MKKRVVSILLCVLLLFLATSCNATQKTKVDVAYFTGGFNPFSVRGNLDFGAVSMTQETVLTEVVSDDGEAVILFDAYSQGAGIADIKKVGETDEYAEYNVKIGDDIKFSNGKDVTSKDVAFSLYVYADINYEGWASVGMSTLVGLKEYRYNNENASLIKITDEDIKDELKNPSELTKGYITERVIKAVLLEEYDWVKSLYTDMAYKGTEAEEHVKLYPNANDLFAYYYSLDTGYKPAKDKDTLINDIAKMYPVDCELLGEIYGTSLTNVAKRYAERALTEQELERMGGEAVGYIEGIKIVDDKNLTIQVENGTAEQLEKILGVFVAPFDVYGKDCEYKDGAFKIDIKSALYSELEPVGIGPAVFKEYKSGSYLVFEKNQHYYKEPEIECDVKFVETGDSSTDYPSMYFDTPDVVYITDYDK